MIFTYFNLNKFFQVNFCFCRCCVHLVFSFCRSWNIRNRWLSSFAMNFANDLITMACEVSVFAESMLQSDFSHSPISHMTDHLHFCHFHHFYQCFCFPFFWIAVLVLYLTGKLAYSNDDATVLFHIFTSLAYFFPLIGAIIADSWLGRYR